MVRNVANLVPPFDPSHAFDGAAAAIEYAVRDLGVDDIIILGRAHCGGIKAMLGAAAGQWPQRDFIGSWVSMALDAGELSLSERDEQGHARKVSLERFKENPGLVERADISGSIRRLKTYPWIKERMDEGNLQLHDWWFDLDSGDLWATEIGSEQLMAVL